MGNIIIIITFIIHLFFYRQLIPEKLAMIPYKLDDRVYMQYILVFYQWMKLEEDNLEWNMRIIEFAEKFMEPCSSLSSNENYAYYIPRYETNSVATRTILHNMKFYNALKEVS